MTETISKRVRWQQETNQNMWMNPNLGELLVVRVMTRSGVNYAGEHARSETQVLRFEGSVNCMKHINTTLEDKSSVELVTDRQVCSSVRQLTLEAQGRNIPAAWKMSQLH